MRILIVLLLSTSLTSTAFAQATTSNSTTTPTTMVNGKFQVGFDGRGNYLKTEKLEKQPLGSDGKPLPTAAVDITSVAGAAPMQAQPAMRPGALTAATAATIPSLSPAPVAAASVQTAAPAPVPAPTPAPAPAPMPTAAVAPTAAPSMRSDSTLRSDISQARAAAAANTLPLTPPAPPKIATGTTTNNGPMVLVGGQIQK